jgi:myosin-5
MNHIEDEHHVVKIYSRYGFLLPLNLSAGQDILSTCVAILHQFRVPPDMYQVGYTKLFFRAGQVDMKPLYSSDSHLIVACKIVVDMKQTMQVGRLEDIRLQTIHGIISFQKIYRGYKARRHFQGLRRSAIFLQSCKAFTLRVLYPVLYCFGYMEVGVAVSMVFLFDYAVIRSRKVQRLFKEMLKKHRAAIQIQRHVRCRAQRKVFLGMKEQVILIQSGNAMLIVTEQRKGLWLG